MRGFRAWLWRFAATFGLGRTNADIQEELRAHREMLTEQYLHRGLTPDEARRQAAAEFGSLPAAAEAYGDRRGLPLIEGSVRDVRMAVRSLKHTPILTLSMVLVLALGIGVSTLVVAVFHAITWATLPVPGAAAVVRVDQKFDGEFDRRVQGEVSRLSYPELETYRQSTRALDAVAGVDHARMNWRQGNGSVPIYGARVTADYFRVLSLTPSVGRLLAANDAQEAVVVISNRLWTRAFGAAPDVVGRTMRLDRETYTIIGVTPPSFSGTDIGHVDVWLPLEAVYTAQRKPSALRDSNVSWLQVLGHLRPGVSLREATADAALIAAQFDRAYPGRRTTIAVTRAARLESALRDQALAIGGVMAFLLLLLFLICGSNAAGLLLARGATRQREMAVRIAIGAARGHIVRQLFAEVCAIALTSGVLGILICVAGVQVLATLPSVADLVEGIQPNAGVLFATLAIAFGLALVCGLAPVRQALRVDCLAGLKGEGSFFSTRVPTLRLRRVLIAVQVTLSIILLVMASLLARGAGQAWRANPGYATNNLYVVQPVSNEEPRLDRASRRRLGADLVDALSHTPGVVAVSQVGLAPFFARGIGQAAASPTAPLVQVLFNAIDERYFETLGVPLVAGRTFQPNDIDVVMINAAMARRFWGDERSAVGQTLFEATGDGKTVRGMRIVGVAPALQTVSVGVPDDPMFYKPLSDPTTGMDALIVRADQNAALQQIVSRTLRGLDLEGFAVINPLDVLVRRQTTPARIGVAIVGAIGMLALAVAAVGIHGLIAFTVASRTRDIGVYRALGAQSRDVIQLLASWTLRGVAIGALLALVVMICVAAAFGSHVQSLLFGLHPLDFASFALGSSILILVIATAIYLPARRALGMAPLEALRASE